MGVEAITATKSMDVMMKINVNILKKAMDTQETAVGTMINNMAELSAGMSDVLGTTIDCEA